MNPNVKGSIAINNAPAPHAGSYTVKHSFLHSGFIYCWATFPNNSLHGLGIKYAPALLYPDDYKATVIQANHPVPSECRVFYFEIEITNKGKIDQESKENETWGCGYHGDDGYSFCSGSGMPYDLSYPPRYTTAFYTDTENFQFYNSTPLSIMRCLLEEGTFDVNKKFLKSDRISVWLLQTNKLKKIESQIIGAVKKVFECYFNSAEDAVPIPTSMPIPY
ncbi:hypothetical protein C2G38_2224474 [Gigaspora rosea]|uniref:SPRY domain-containing protein n=1 Tax=Gigaspora rosea TaxID=44941 RepID=A0A397U053_9GLOM|nr:hypothetical protein C2G38_2224474 [Gigaspora rosea]